MKQTRIHHMEHLFKKMMTCALGLRVAGGAVLFVALLFVVSCSSEQEEMPQVEQTETEMDIELVASARGVKAAETRGVTRSWAPPTSFYEYDDLYESDGSIYANYQTLSDKTIDVFFTKGTETPMHGKLNYSSGTRKWKLAFKDIKPEAVTAGDYYVYGFIPRSVASSASIALLDSDHGTTYADGAILTMNGVPAVISDACVIIGAREGFRTGTEGNYTYYDGGYDDGTDTRTNRLTQGDFKFKLKNTVEDGVAVPSDNYLFLLFDHLCSAISISMKVHNEYDALRTIKVKKIHMNTANDDGITKLMNVTVVLNANDSGTDPIESVTYTPTATESTGGNVFTSAEGLQLGTTQKRFLTHFVPEGVHTMVLTTTYDIYDKKGNLIRKDCKATNTLKFNELIDRFESAERGVLYSLNLTIQPTYLYVLSEPDLNNPEFTVE